MKRLIEIVHGAGAQETWEILTKIVFSKVPQDLKKTKGGYGIDIFDDGAVIPLHEGFMVVSIDSYTVNPIFFPGGNIGTLAASGTINDLVVMGARPIAVLDAIVVEEGFDIDILDRIVDDMLSVLRRYGIPLIGGDFKVMPRGNIDKIVITMVGLGFSYKPIIDIQIEENDRIIVTGPVAEHGATILAAQLGMIDKVKGLRSDAKPLMDLLPLFEKYRECIHAARDPTRGGIASVLNEWIRGTDKMIVIERSKVPIRSEVRRFLDTLGIDFLSVASEGVAVLAVSEKCADIVIKELHRSGFSFSQVIGIVRKATTDFLKGKVIAITEIGGKVIVEPRALNLPRIC